MSSEHAGGPLRVAAVQMTSTTRVDANLRAAETLIAEAAAQGARLVALPEYFCIMGARDTDKVAVRETEGHGPIQEFLAAQAARHKVWLVGGTLPLAAREADRVLNTVLVFDPSGRRAARYASGSESYDEARTIAPGAAVSAFDLELPGVRLRVGLSVCYDLRFPELYRSLAGSDRPCDLILVPAAFTAVTGRAHWETLLRARAIENLCYVLAPAQAGRHDNGRATFGHSMLVDPWGQVMACRTDTEGPGVVIGDVDPARIAQLRTSLPALSHRII
jgi:predicted amidohydrolase